MELDRAALNNACFSLAKNRKWERRPIDVGSIETLATRLADIAMDYVEYLEAQGRDPNIVVRAIRYIQHHHGYPEGDRTDGFRERLEVLVELASPNTGATADSEAFYQDIEQGMAEARAEYR
jgi:hypothetical protein